MDPSNLISLWLSKVILRTLTPETKSKFREVERTSIKLIEVSSHQLFNRCCLNNNLLPAYTNVTLHDEAARTEEFTFEFRKKLVHRQIEQQSQRTLELQIEIGKLKQELSNLLHSDLRDKAVSIFLSRILDNKRIALTTRHNAKLIRLNGGPILLKEHKRTFLNLSTCQISPCVGEILDLGMNCHLRSKYDSLTKKIEIEKLYRNIQEQQDRNRITVQDSERFKC